MKELLRRYDNYALSISATTRSPREGEENGREYFFKTREEFERMIAEGALIEHACYVENYYGTPRAYVEQQLGLAGDSQDPENQTPDDQTGTDVNATTPGTGDTTEPSTDQETTDVLLYFVSADTNSLEAEVRAIPKEEGLARATVNQLLSGPREEDLVAAIPSSVSLRDIDVSNGVCTVDLSADVATLASIPETDQVLALYSLVNTLTQFDTVDYVQVLLNGQQLSDFGGVDASQALAPQDL